MGSYKWGCKSPNMGYEYSYPNYNPCYNYPCFGFRVQAWSVVFPLLCFAPLLLICLRRTVCLDLFGREFDGSGFWG